MSKHYWYATNAGNDYQGLVVEEHTGKTIAVAYDKKDTPMLAAAPEMYEALKLIASYGNEIAKQALAKIEEV